MLKFGWNYVILSFSVTQYFCRNSNNMHKIYKRKKNQIGFDFLHFDRKYDECEKPDLHSDEVYWACASHLTKSYNTQVKLTRNIAAMFPVLLLLHCLWWSVQTDAQWLCWFLCRCSGRCGRRPRWPWPPEAGLGRRMRSARRPDAGQCRAVCPAASPSWCRRWDWRSCSEPKRRRGQNHS